MFLINIIIYKGIIRSLDPIDYYFEMLRPAKDWKNLFYGSGPKIKKIATLEEYGKGHLNIIWKKNVDSEISLLKLKSKVYLEIELKYINLC